MRGQTPGSFGSLAKYSRKKRSIVFVAAATNISIILLADFVVEIRKKAAIKEKNRFFVHEFFACSLADNNYERR